MRLATAAAWVTLPIAAGVGLYLLKMQVEAQVQHLAKLEQQITETRESIHVLKAEWSFLNDPARLREQAGRLLAMQPVKPSQIVSYDSIPFADPPAAPAAMSNAAPGNSSAPAATGNAAPAAIGRATPDNDQLKAMIAALADAKRSKRP